MNKFIIETVAAIGMALTVAAPGVAGANEFKASGTFKGASDHITTGNTTIVKTSNGGAVLILDSNFSLDGAPDPRVGLGKDGKYDASTDLGVLANNTGLQVYVIPASVNIDDLNEVYIWCKKFAVPLGVASIK